MCMWGIGIWPLIYYITEETPKERVPLLLMLERNAFGCIVFERRVGQQYMCVEILFYSAILFYLNLPIKWSLQSARMTNSPVFFNEKTHYPEREVKNKYLYFVKPIRFWASFNHTMTSLNQCSRRQTMYTGQNNNAESINNIIKVAIDWKPGTCTPIEWNYPSPFHGL